MAAKWTLNDIEKLKRLYPTNRAVDLINEFPNRKANGISLKARLLNLQKEVNTCWTQYDIDKLTILYPISTSNKLLEEFPNRTISSIQTKAQSLGIKKISVWTEEEIKKLKSIYSKLPIENLLKEFPNRSRQSIIMKASLLKVKKLNPWTNEEINKLKSLYPTTKFKILLKEFPQRSHQDINDKASKLKIPKIINGQERISDVSPLLNEDFISYYWIGYIFADGSIDYNRFTLSFGQSETDENQVRRLAKFLNCNVQYRIKPKGIIMGKKVNSKPSYVLNITDTILIPKLVEKFDFKPLKTYNPPDLFYFDNKDINFFIAFLIGFIDGDGTIQLVKTKEGIKTTEENAGINIAIKCHKKWMSTLTYISEKITNYLNLKKYTCEINKADMASISFSSFKIARFLKLKTIELNLPVLERKWNKIDENKITKNESALLDEEKLLPFLNGDYSTQEIMRIFNMTETRVLRIKNKLMLFNPKITTKPISSVDIKNEYRLSNPDILYGTCKLTAFDVINIRYLYKNNQYLRKELCSIFGVNNSTIGNIINNKTWKHLL
jgi:hypothetical protein